jgi:hypothetical protein
MTNFSAKGSSILDCQSGFPPMNGGDADFFAVITPAVCAVVTTKHLKDIKYLVGFSSILVKKGAFFGSPNRHLSSCRWRVP